MTKRVSINDATEAELRAFAADNLGLPINHNTAIQSVRAKIEASWDKDYILVEDPAPSEDEPARGSAPPGAPRAEQKVAEMVTIVVQRTEEPGGDRPVEVGVNGSIMLIPRGEPVQIPRSYYMVLSTAVKKIYDPMPDGKGLNPIPRHVPAYPFSRVA